MAWFMYWKQTPRFNNSIEIGRLSHASTTSYYIPSQEIITSVAPASPGMSHPAACRITIRKRACASQPHPFSPTSLLTARHEQGWKIEAHSDVILLSTFLADVMSRQPFLPMLYLGYGVSLRPFGIK